MTRHYNDTGHFVFDTDDEGTVVMFAILSSAEDAMVYEQDCIHYHGHWGRDLHPRRATKREICRWLRTDDSGRIELRIVEEYRTQIEAIVRRCTE